MNNKLKTILLFISLFSVIACENNYVPKPNGYFRIDTPEKSYKLVDTIPAYQFELPVYAELLPDMESPFRKNWITIEFPQFEGSVYISHKEVNNNLSVYLEDMHTMLMKHLPKASAIQDSMIIDSDRNVYGLIFSLQGKSVASPVQFYLTDSTSNFVRGALYFNINPNNDSLAPVIGFLKKDIDNFINTLQWKK